MLDEHQTRLNKLTELKRIGLEAYPDQAQQDCTIAEFLENFSTLEKQSEIITLCGRLRSIRRQGALAFAHIEDVSGQLQIFIRKDELGDKEYAIFKDLIDVGDFLQISGTAFTTKSGEKSLLIKKIKLLTKALRPLPEKWHGLKDREARYRQRYLDLLANKESKDLFLKRSKFIHNIRTRGL